MTLIAQRAREREIEIVAVLFMFEGMTETVVAPRGSFGGDKRDKGTVSQTAQVPKRK